MDKEEIVEELISILTKELEIYKPPKNKYANFLNLLMLARPIERIDDYLLNLQNRYLTLKIEERKIKTFKDYTFKKGVSETQDDLFSINADMLIAFSDELLSSNLEDFNLIDNALVLNGGMQIKYDLFKLLLLDGYVLDYGKPYIVDAGNLCVNKIAKILISQTKNVCEENQKLFNAISSAFNFAKENGYKNILINIKNIKTLKQKNLIIEFVNILNKKYKFKIIFKN